MIESEKLELKLEYTEDIKKEIIAFANTQGGELIIGIDDQGQVVGVDKPDLVSTQVTNMIRDAISPDISLCTRVEVRQMDDKQIVHVQVNRGNKRPYYLTKKGMTSSGVYIRHGSSSAPASADAIREMIRDTDGYSYESNLSFEQNLTFEYCRKVFEKKDIRFGKNQMKTMQLLTQEELYTNLAMLLSDQCFHTIQLARFQGTEVGVFTDRQRFTGSILKQLDEAYSVMNRYNRVRSEIHGLYRVDTRDYPEAVLREALVNAVVHRDYDRDVSINLRVFDDRIEIASYGGLPPNTTIDTFMLGLSMPRNKRLADIFYRLELIEAYGSGIPKMTNIYQDYGQHISFKITPSGFLIVLPNLNYAKEKRHEIHSQLSQLDQDLKLAVDYVRKNETASRSDLEKILGISRSTASKKIEQLVEMGLLIRVGAGRNTRYAYKSNN